MSQKIIKIGSSLGVTIPQNLLQKLGLTAGKRVELESRKDTIVVSPVKKDADPAEITRLTKNFIDRYRKDLEALRDK